MPRATEARLHLRRSALRERQDHVPVALAAPVISLIAPLRLEATFPLEFLFGPAHVLCMMSERNGIASKSGLSSRAPITSDDPPTRGLDRYGPDEIEPLAFERYFDRINFLRLGGYPLAAAIITAWRMGKGKAVYADYSRTRPALLDEFGPPTPLQMFARLGLLLAIALGSALVAKLLV